MCDLQARALSLNLSRLPAALVPPSQPARLPPNLTLHRRRPVGRERRRVGVGEARHGVGVAAGAAPDRLARHGPVVDDDDVAPREAADAPWRPLSLLRARGGCGAGRGRHWRRRGCCRSLCVDERRCRDCCRHCRQREHRQRGGARWRAAAAPLPPSVGDHDGVHASRGFALKLC